MYRKPTEDSAMNAMVAISSTEFVSRAFQDRIAPMSLGSVKVRHGHAITKMMQRNEVNRRQGRRYRWAKNRVIDCFKGDPRISVNAEELRDIEEMTGLRYAVQELREIDDLISAADALLAGPEADFYRPFVDAIRAMARAFDRSGNQT